MLEFDVATIITGVWVFFARIIDVTMGTVRTISIVHGRTKSAFVLGFMEVTMWLVVISTVIKKISSRPILGIFYALGFSFGNVVGILVEKKMSYGSVGLRIISTKQGLVMARKIRKMGFGVTTFEGKGKSGPVIELYIVCGRRDLKIILPAVNQIDPRAFYITEQVGLIGKFIRPFMPEPTGWRSIFKKK